MQLGQEGLHPGVGRPDACVDDPVAAAIASARACGVRSASVALRSASAVDQRVLRRRRRQEGVDLGLRALDDETRRHQRFGGGRARAHDRLVDPRRHLVEPRQVGRHVGGAPQRLGLRHELDQRDVRPAHLVEDEAVVLERLVGRFVFERPLHDGGRHALGVAERAGGPLP